jgi:hypothetical protein
VGTLIILMFLISNSSPWIKKIKVNLSKFKIEKMSYGILRKREGPLTE